MNVRVIIEIIDFIRKELESRRVVEKYMNLVAVIKTIKSSPDTDPTANLAEAKNELIRALSETEPANWPYSKRKILAEFDKDNMIGLRAVSYINSIFEANQANPSKISRELTRIIERTNRFLSSGSEALVLLNCFSVPDSDPSEKTLLTLLFEGKTAVLTINDIERYTRIWNNIINDFAMLSTQSGCRPVVENIDKSSIALNIPEGDLILNAILFGIVKVVDSYSRILRIRKLQLEALKLSLDSNIREQLANEVSVTINDASEHIVTELMEMHHCSNDELFNRIKKSLKLILDFIEKGGKIECRLSADNNAVCECNEKLNSAYSVVSEIENTVKEISGFRISLPEVQEMCIN